MSRAVFVIGPQGSGSSATAGAIHFLGISMGDNLKGKNLLNPKGHYEDKDFVNIVDEWNKGINHHNIETIIHEYVKKRNVSPLWGLKMPHLGILGKYLIPHIQECRVVSIDRNPVACIRSASLKYKEKTIDSITAMHETVRKLRKQFIEEFSVPNLEVDFNELTENPNLIVRQIAAFCFEGMEFPSDRKIEEAIAFVDPVLNHKRELQ